MGLLSKIKSSINLGGSKISSPKLLKNQLIIEPSDDLGPDYKSAIMTVEVLSEDEALDYHHYKNPLVTDGEHEADAL